jgi:hypothetical protein
MRARHAVIIICLREHRRSRSAVFGRSRRASYLQALLLPLFTFRLSLRGLCLWVGLVEQAALDRILNSLLGIGIALPTLCTRVESLALLLPFRCTAARLLVPRQPIEPKASVATGAFSHVGQRRGLIRLPRIVNRGRIALRLLVVSVYILIGLGNGLAGHARRRVRPIGEELVGGAVALF